MANQTHLALILGALLASVLLIPFARELLFERSIADIKWFRKNFAHGWIFDYGDYFVSKESYQLCFFLCTLYSRSDYNFVGALSQGLAVCLVALEKVYFQSPRPNFIDNHIPVDCHYIDYGAPSAHSMLGVVSWGSVWAMSMKSTKASRTT